MQEQTRLIWSGRSNQNLSGFIKIAAMVTMICLFVSLTGWAAEDQGGGVADSKAAVASQRKKAEEMLDIATEQIKRCQFDQAQATLDQCNKLNGNLSAFQQKHLSNLAGEAQLGIKSQNEANQAITEGKVALEGGEIGLAGEKFNRAQGFQKFLPQESQAELKQLLEQVKSLQAQKKAEIKVLFQTSVKYYKQGHLEQARTGFSKVKQSGVELSWLDRGGDFTDVDGYLKKITEQTGKSTAAVNQSDASQQAESPAVLAAGDEAAESELTNAAKTTASEEVSSTGSETSSGKQAKDKVGLSVLWPFGKKEPVYSAETLKELDQLMAQGHLAMEKGNYAQARQYFLQALEINPDLESAKKGIAAAEYSLTRPKEVGETAKPTILEDVIRQEELQKQYIETRFTEAKSNISRLMSQNQFEQAQAEVSQMLATIEGYKSLLRERYKVMQSELSALLSQIEEQKTSWERLNLQQQREEAQRREGLRQMRTEQDRQAKIQELFNRAKSFRAEREFDQAVSTLKRLLELDPKHEQAKLLMEYMEDLQMLSRQAEVQNLRNLEEVRVLNDVQKSSIPFSGIVTYPGQPIEFEEQDLNWLELTERRRHKIEQTESADLAVYEHLENTKINLDYNEIEFQQVINDLQVNHDLNINVLWGSLETTAGINRDDMVSIQFPIAISLEKALNSILEYVSSDKYAKALYTIDEGVITIAAEGDLPEKYYIEIYYVADLLGQRSEGYSMTGMGGMGGMGGGMGGGMMGGGMGGG
ncbi:MAG: tetratricopeptide repeat protein, partial [Sedimentisphaerales bacterium]|nr:tetratricopeptide repeat protein [Sedimentisphaerales bacterium]